MIYSILVKSKTNIDRRPVIKNIEESPRTKFFGTAKQKDSRKNRDAQPPPPYAWSFSIPETFRKTKGTQAKFSVSWPPDEERLPWAVLSQFFDNHSKWEVIMIN